MSAVVYTSKVHHLFRAEPFFRDRVPTDYV